MANVPFSHLHDLVLPYLPGAELPMVNSQIRKAVREFMKRTALYRENFQFSTLANVSTYQLNPTFGQVSSIIDAWKIDGKTPLKCVTEDRRPPVDADEPTGWFTTTPQLFSLYPQPDGVYPISVNAVITLSQTDVELPEELVAHYGEALAAGTMAAMYSMPGKPWTQRQSAQEAGRLFNGIIRTVRGELRDGGQPNQSTFTGIARFGV